MNPSYPSNLTSEQWELLSGLIPAAEGGGRKRSVDMEAVVNAIFYVLCAGWRKARESVTRCQEVENIGMIGF